MVHHSSFSPIGLTSHAFWANMLFIPCALTRFIISHKITLLLSIHFFISSKLFFFHSSWAHPNLPLAPLPCINILTLQTCKNIRSVTVPLLNISLYINQVRIVDLTWSLITTIYTNKCLGIDKLKCGNMESMNFKQTKLLLYCP